MSAERVLFDFFGLLALAAAIAGALFARDRGRAAVALLATSVSLSVLFALLGAGLLAGLQLLVASGTSMVLLLVDASAEPRLEAGRSTPSPAGAIASAVGLGMAALLAFRWLGSRPIAAALAREARPERALGRVLFGDFALAAAAMGLLLLAAMIGALLLARPRERD